MRVCPAKDSILQTVAFAAWTLNRAIEIFDGAGILLSKRQSREASEALLQHLRAYQYLGCHHGVESAPYLFRVLPKCHYMWHTAMQTRSWQLNAFVFDCFAPESWLGKIKAVARQCHGKTMTGRVMSRYLICLALYLENHRRRVQAFRGS